jgi:hypothetical protein
MKPFRRSKIQEIKAHPQKIQGQRSASWLGLRGPEISDLDLLSSLKPIGLIKYVDCKISER